MGNLTDAERPLPFDKAYPRWRRVRHAMQHVAAMAKIGNGTFEGTVSARIANTYGIEEQLVKRMKARKRCELSPKGEE